jgi:selenocysteine lyase/cysteine desulfurase
MAALALPITPDEATTEALTTALAEVDRIEVPVGPFPVRAAREAGAAPTHALLRLSAQRYNEPADYERLADALARRGLGPNGGRAATSGASAIVAG